MHGHFGGAMQMRAQLPPKAARHADARPCPSTAMETDKARMADMASLG